MISNSGKESLQIHHILLAYLAFGNGAISHSKIQMM